MSKIVKYLNLTNGLEYLDEVKDFKLIRIQSSLCESKCWDRLIKDLDYNFLFDLAQGKMVQVYDASPKQKNCPSQTNFSMMQSKNDLQT